jgi:sugar phosphate permease
MMGILRDGIESWLPTLYSEAFNRDASESILVSVSLPIFSILSITAITALHKNRLFKNEVRGSLILFALVIIATLPIVFLIAKTSVVARFASLILCCLVCAFMHGVNFLLISCLPGRFSAYGKAATTSGFCNAFTYVGAAISSYGMAVISEASGWRTTVIAWIIIGALGILFTLLSLIKYTKFIKDGENR